MLQHRKPMATINTVYTITVRILDHRHLPNSTYHKQENQATALLKLLLKQMQNGRKANSGSQQDKKSIKRQVNTLYFLKILKFDIVSTDSEKFLIMSGKFLLNFFFQKKVKLIQVPCFAFLISLLETCIIGYHFPFSLNKFTLENLNYVDKNVILLI